MSAAINLFVTADEYRDNSAAGRPLSNSLALASEEEMEPEDARWISETFRLVDAAATAYLRRKGLYNDWIGRAQ